MKKLLLSIVPALMLLGSCAGAQPKVENNLFQEDTLLNNDLFGKVDSGLRKASRNAIPFDSSHPAIGIQTLEAGGKISIRYIAAVQFADAAAVSAATAVWTRTMYKDNGDVLTGKETDDFPCAKAYTSVVDNGDTLTIDKFNEDYGTSYTHFVVYTMRNIPYNKDVAGTYDGYYLNAYLTVNSGTPSDVVSTTIDGSKKVAFPVTQTGYFLKGSFAGKDPLLPADKTTKGSNDASFAYSLTAGDYFLIVKNTASNFQVFDSSVLKGAGNPIGEDFRDESGLIVAKNSADYILYLNSDGELWRRNGVEDFKIVGSFDECDWKWTKGITGSIDYNYDGSANLQMKFTFTVTEDTGFKVVRHWEGDSYTWYGESNSTVKGGGHWNSGPDDYNIWVHAGSYEVYVRVASNDSITTIIFKNPSNYYLVGTIDGKTDWGTDKYNFVKNTNSDTEEYYISSVSFKDGDEIKVKNGESWYPGTNIGIVFTDNKAVYLRPNGDGDEWIQNTIYLGDPIS